MKKFLANHVVFSDELSKGRAICMTYKKGETTKEQYFFIKKNNLTELILISVHGGEDKLTIEEYLNYVIEITFLTKEEVQTDKAELSRYP